MMMAQHGETHPEQAEKRRARRADQPAIYRIQVQGRLRPSWSDWFDGMAVEAETRAPGLTVTTLTGPVADQAALHGQLIRVRDLGLVLLCVERLAETAPEE